MHEIVSRRRQHGRRVWVYQLCEYVKQSFEMRKANAIAQNDDVLEETSEVYYMQGRWETM